MLHRLFVAALLVTLIVTWFMLPRVTEKDAVAYAHAMFLEHCNQRMLNPAHFKRPEFHVEGGDKDLIFVYQYDSDIHDSVRIRINKSGDYWYDVLPKALNK